MKLKKIVLGIIAVLMIVSCEDLINVDQPDIIEQEQAFSDKNSTRLSMLGLYGLMTELVEPMFLAGEVRADLAIANESANTNIKEFSNNSFSASNPYVSAKPFYTIINNANDFINEFEGKLENQQMDSTDFYNYKAELVAIRVWTQFQVAKIFGNCRYYTGVNSDSLVEYSIEDTSFISILIKDLTFSDTLTFTTTTDNVIWQTIRFSDFFVNELLGELYMEMGDYKNALKKFDEVLFFGDQSNRINGRFKLTVPFSNPDDWFDQLFVNPMESSTLTSYAVSLIAFDNKYNQTNELWNWTLSLNYQVAPAKWYTEQFNAYATDNIENQDARVASIHDNNSRLGRDYVISKYTEDDKPFIITRAARISLNRAFCYNASGDGTKALKEIATLRKRIKAPTFDEKAIPEDENEAIKWVEDAIIDEMAYETGFEGQRWYDLVRVANRRNDPSYLANKVAQKYPLESREKIRNRLMDKANWYVPVFE